MAEGTQRQNLAILLGVILLAIFAVSTAAQCEADPDGKTAIRFNNESSRDVDFYIDRVYACTLPSGDASDEFDVEPGSYLLIGVTMIDGAETWVSVFNKVPAKNVCTWTVADPEPAKDVARKRSLGGYL